VPVIVVAIVTVAPVPAASIVFELVTGAIDHQPLGGRAFDQSGIAGDGAKRERTAARRQCAGIGERAADVQGRAIVHRDGA